MSWMEAADVPVSPQEAQPRARLPAGSWEASKGPKIYCPGQRKWHKDKRNWNLATCLHLSDKNLNSEMGERETKWECPAAPRVRLQCCVCRCRFHVGHDIFTREVAASWCQAWTLASWQSGALYPFLVLSLPSFLLSGKDMAPEQEINEEVCRGECFLPPRKGQPRICWTTLMSRAPSHHPSHLMPNLTKGEPVNCEGGSAMHLLMYKYPVYELFLESEHWALSAHYPLSSVLISFPLISP